MKDREWMNRIICNAKWILIALAFILFVFFANAQDVKVEVRSEPSQVLIGDYIQWSYDLKYNPAEFNVQIVPPGDSLGRFEMVERKKVDTVLSGENLQVRQTFMITCFDSGRWVIPPYEFRIQPLNGQNPYSLFSDSLVVDVRTVAVDTAKPIKPIYEIIEARRSWRDYIPYLLTGVAGLLLLLGIIYYFKKRNVKKKTPEAKIAYRPPWEEAILRLNELEMEKMWEQDEKKYHTEIADTIRTYLEEGFHLYCFEKTSGEIVTDFKKVLKGRQAKNRQEILEQLRSLLNLADLVKFAKSKPTPEDHLQAVEVAKAFITKTYKIIEQELQKEGGE